MSITAPLFNRVFPLYFFRVGLCSHTILFIAGDVATRRALDRVGSPRSRGPESTRSLITTRAKKRVSGLRSMAYLAPRGRCYSAGSSSNGGRCDHDHHRDLLPSNGGRSSESWTTRSRDRGHPLTLSVIRRLRGHVEELHDHGPIEP